MEQLENSRLFRSINEEETERILKCSKSRMKDYPAGHYIFEQGSVPSKLFLLIKGQIQICKDFNSGKRDVLYLVEPGNVFGEIFLFADRKHYWYDAVAVRMPVTITSSLPRICWRSCLKTILRLPENSILSAPLLSGSELPYG